MIICAAHTCFLSTEYVPGVALGAGDRVVNESGGAPSPAEELGILLGANQKAGADTAALDALTEQAWW